MNLSTETQQSYLTFRLGDEVFASNVNKVLEILEIPHITKVPLSPGFLRGVINLRGNVLPVIDSRAKFGLPAVADSVNSCIIVVNVNIDGQDITVGSVVDAVLEVMMIEDGKVQPAPAIGARYKAEFIEGMVKCNDNFIMMLDLNKVFSSAEVSMLRDAATSSDS